MPMFLWKNDSCPAKESFTFSRRFFIIIPFKLKYPEIGTKGDGKTL